MKIILSVVLLFVQGYLFAQERQPSVIVDTQKVVVDTLTSSISPLPEIEATFSQEELQKKVVYPEMARKAGIQGDVYVRVFVNKNGEPKKIEIYRSESKMLNDAAIKAVRETKFVPAKTNGVNISSWLMIPIKFRLLIKK